MRIFGKITDVNGNPLPKATIKKITGLSANQIGVISDDNGSFDLNSQSISSKDEFQITYIGFEPKRLYASELNGSTIKMIQNDINIEPVTIISKIAKKPETVNNFKLHLQKHKTLYAGIGGLLGLGLIFASIKKL